MESSDISQIIEKFANLLEKSESRIDRTNEMVTKCVNVINKVTEEYTIQLEKLQTSRDEILRQNGELLALLQRQSDNNEMSNKRYDNLLEKTLNIVSSKSENNINVK